MRIRHPHQGPQARRASAAAAMPRRVAPHALVVLAVLFAVVGVGVGRAGDAFAAPVSFEIPFRCGEVWYGGTRAGSHGHAIDFNQAWPDSIDETGVPVLASAAGTVTVAHKADSWGGGYGYWVEIDHGAGWRTRYAHLYAPPLVNVGQWVPAGHHIGGVGNTGNSFGAHLHFEQTLHGAKQPPTFRGVPFDLRYQNGAYQGERVVSQNGCGPVRVPNPCGSFWDTPTGGFCESILWAVGQGITTGYGDGTFLPESAVSRQAMAAFLYRFVGATPVSSPQYRDVTVPHAFDVEIGWLQSTGLTTGYADGTFRPTAPITRQALAVFLWRLAGEPIVDGPQFSDVPSSHEFRHAITWMASTGLSTGYADGTFRPGNVLSRQAMVAFLHRMDGPARAGLRSERSADDAQAADTFEAAVPVDGASTSVPVEPLASSPDVADGAAGDPTAGDPTTADGVTVAATGAPADGPAVDGSGAAGTTGPATGAGPGGGGLPEGVEVGVGSRDGGQEAAGPGEAASP